MYLNFISFPNTDTTQVAEVFPQVRQVLTQFYIVNIMGADVLTTQEARASTSMIMTMLNRNNSVPAR